MQKAAKPVPSANPTPRCRYGFRRQIRVLGYPLLETAVGAVTVEMLDVLPEHMGQTARPEYE